MERMVTTETLGDDDGDSTRDSQLLPEADTEGKEGSPWAKTLPTEPPPPSAPVDGVVEITIPDEILADPNTLWRCYVVGYFIGYAPHIGSIHATVNRLWSSPKMGNKIDVQFLEKNTILFRIENPQMRARVIQRRYWHIANIPLVVNEWSPETALDPPDLSAMPIWIDLKGVPSPLFSQVLVEVNLCKPLVEKISCLDKDGRKVMIDVSYPWLPPKCNVCAAWGHKGSSCSSKNVQILHKDKEILSGSGHSEEVMNGTVAGTLGRDGVGDVSRKGFEVGGTSKPGTEVETQSAENQFWALVGRESPPPPRNGENNETNGDEMQGEDEVIISPSRFSVLALEDIVEENEKEEDELEEGEMEIGELKVGAKIKDSSKSGRLRSTKLKLLKFEMRLLKKTHYGNLPNKTKLAFEEMCHCQNV
ncbi:hypothetical protein HID58_086025, partial [Brassica napus]